MSADWQEPEEWKKDGSTISGISRIKTGAWTSFLAAKETRNGKQIDVIIKTFAVPEEILNDPDRIVREREKFLVSARLQKQLTDAGCAAWVDILRLSENPPAFMMKKCGASLQDLLDRKVHLAADDLYQIVLSVLQGFAEIFDKHKRSHGSLKPSDVLAVPNEHPPYQLADPAPKGETHSANDLYALGCILFHLIENREWDPLTPIIPTKNWSRFGSRRDRWIQFLNMILSPNGCQEPLANVRREALRLKPASPVRGAAIIAACIALLAGAGVAAYYLTPGLRRTAAPPTTGSVANAIDPEVKANWQTTHENYTAVNDKWQNRERNTYDHAKSTEAVRAARAMIADTVLSDTAAYQKSAAAYTSAAAKLTEALALYATEDEAGHAKDQVALGDFDKAQHDFNDAKSAWDAAAAQFKSGHDHAHSTAYAQATVAPPATAPADAAGREAAADQLRTAAKRYTDAVAMAKEESLAGTSIEQAQAAFQETKTKFQQARDRWDASAAGITFDFASARTLADQARASIPDQVILTNPASYQAATDQYQAALNKLTSALDLLDKLKKDHNAQESDVSTAVARANEALQKKDDESALAWYRKAADLGNAAAMENVGLFYEIGRGTEKNEAEAAKWYQKAAALNQPAALVSLGMLYEKGHGVDKDVKKALDLYKKAADLKDTSAMRNIGYLYDNGVGTGKDPFEALRWYQKAADLNDSSAMFLVGVFHEQGKGVPIDYKQAVTWYTKAADLKNPRAMNAMGVLAETGRGMPQDAAKALEWYKKAAELNFAPAMSNVGALYDQGIGVPLDHAEAFKWFKKGADLGNAMSMYNLAVLYETGRGTPLNMAQAVQWYQLAANSDDEQAKKQALERLGSLGFPAH